MFLFSSVLSKITGNVLRLALSGVAPTPSHYKYNKTFHSAADFPKENPEVAIEANRCCELDFLKLFYPSIICSFSCPLNHPHFSSFLICQIELIHTCHWLQSKFAVFRICQINSVYGYG